MRTARVGPPQTAILPSPCRSLHRQSRAPPAAAASSARLDLRRAHRSAAASTSSGLLFLILHVGREVRDRGHVVHGSLASLPSLCVGVVGLRLVRPNGSTQHEKRPMGHALGRRAGTKHVVARTVRHDGLWRPVPHRAVPVSCRAVSGHAGPLDIYTLHTRVEVARSIARMKNDGDSLIGGYGCVGSGLW